ncbi:MAG TPA: cyclase family protein, partial [Solirubrobacteraceae bacterium]|nr:cyclase family protein [Solirubrobacteraceae bacterium]
TERLLELAAGARVFDLGRAMFPGMPQSPNHPAYTHALPRRHGDAVRAGGGSAANDLIVTGTHVGTHIDALAHVSQDGLLHGGIDAAEAQSGGKFLDLGVHTVEPWLCRGVLLDIQAALGGTVCGDDHEVTPDELDAAVERQGVEPRPGDVVLIRTGWGRRFDDGAPFVGRETGTPGVGEAGALWLARRRVRAAGAETIAFERIAPGAGHSVLLAHRVLLVDHGIHIVETMDLEELAQAQAYEFLFVLTPLKLVGATGSPVRPLAVVAGD